MLLDDIDFVLPAPSPSPPTKGLMVDALALVVRFGGDVFLCTVAVVAMAQTSLWLLLCSSSCSSLCLLLFAVCRWLRLRCGRCGCVGRRDWDIGVVAAMGYFLCNGLNMVSRSGRPLSRPPRSRFESAVHLLAR